ncbi:MAG: histidine phosphatase family protein [Phycisphaeraceae bacterium]
MEIYLIRHGDMAGDPHACYEPPVSGCLSVLGRQQVDALARALAEVRFDRVFSSPLGRAIQTAQPLASQSDAAIELLPWLTEWRPAPVMGECADADFESILAAAAKLRPEECWKTPAGEGTLEMAHRIICGFVKLMTQLGAPPGHGGYLLNDPDRPQRIALVAHGGSLGCLAAFLLGIPIRPYAPLALAQTGVARFTLEPRADVWYPLLHLPAPVPAAAAVAVADPALAVK